MELSYHLAQAANWTLSLIGFSPDITIESHYIVPSLGPNYPGQGVWIGEPCNGLKVFGIYVSFIIAYGINWRQKLIFSIGGILIIHLVNILRIAALIYLAGTFPDTLDFNHNITFQILTYGIIILLWYIWYIRQSKLQKEPN